MAEWKATPEQQAAAQDRGGALLVAAAAGSGKTKVLVDRLMGYLTDPDDPADLDEFLIITYTRAAAAELRGKIAARLGEMLAEDPDNKHLQRQLTRVYLAQISTVHAFCQTVLRQYAAEADLPADFRVADEQQAAALRAEALQDTLAELYAGLDANPDFAAMIDTLGYGRDDRRLLALAEESYGVMRCQVDPAAWTRRCLQAYDLPEDAEAEQTLWGAWFLQERTRVLENADALLRQAEDLCRREPKLEEKCTPVLEKKPRRHPGSSRRDDLGRLHGKKDRVLRSHAPAQGRRSRRAGQGPAQRGLGDGQGHPALLLRPVPAGHGRSAQDRPGSARPARAAQSL